MKKLFIIYLLFVLPGIVSGQQLSNLRQKILAANSDTIRLDTLSIIPESLFLKSPNDSIISNDLYQVDYNKSQLILTDLRNSYDTVHVNYRVYPINFSKKYFHKDANLIKGKSYQMNPGYYPGENGNANFLSPGLNKSGSITRGISFGNQQDAVLNSNLNLQLSGKLNNDLNISAAISDDNIPIQPDGSSQQIQEFDKVYIRLYNEKNNLIAGDFELESPVGYFFRMNKKAKGAIYTTQWDSKAKNYQNKTTISGALSKGKYCRKPIAALEGTQGPYRLQGCDNESYIIVLSGTEKIYIDGRLLIRGQENDYIINYNTAEITFTPNQPITKDKRIIVEFEYSEQNYARFLVFNSNEFYNDKNSFYINIYNENDSKNQTLNVDLNDDQKRLLGNTGDNIENAYYPNIYKDSVYNQNYIYYKLTDTLVNHLSGQSAYFDSVFVYSTNPEFAFYRLGFSNVGEGNGNYVLSSTNLNGKVYEWIAPDINGNLLGSYEPVVLLITPKKKQMVTIGGASKLNLFDLNYELAMSNTDINTFSDLDSKDNVGYAFKAELFKTKIPIKNAVFDYNINYEFNDKYFSPIERYRNAEFERDWNLQAQKEKYSQHFAGFHAGIQHKNKLNTSYNLSFIDQQKTFTAIRNNLLFDYDNAGRRVFFNGSYVNTASLLNNTFYYRHLAEVSRSLKIVKFGLINEVENNLWKDKETDSLLVNSMAFSQWEYFIKNADSLSSNFFASYKYRQDFLPSLNENQLLNSSKGEDFMLGFDLYNKAGKTLKTTFTYRKLSILDTALTNLNEDKSLLGRIESNLRFFKGAINSSTLYEIGSGLESIKEYAFVEVDNGLGIYIWNDYNNNDIQELEEFEIASYKDTANYIRVQLPGDYIKVYTTAFNQVLNLRPSKSWYKEQGLKKLFSRFSDQLAYRISSKTKSDQIIENINPFTTQSNQNEIVTLAYSFKNTISFNRTNPVFGVDFMYHRNARKDLLLSGYNAQENRNKSLKFRWNVSQKITVMEDINTNTKNYTSDAYSAKNYDLNELGNIFSISYQPTFSYRILLKHTYSEKENVNSEKAIENNYGTEFKYNNSSKGNLTFLFNFLQLSYNGETNSALAYEMLQGFLPGNNITWTLQYQQQLANSLQLNFTYNGRKLPDSAALHSGGVQLRAFF